MEIKIEKLIKKHWPEVKKIYEEGIATKNATFNTMAPNWKEWDSAHLPHSRYVVLEKENVLGWVALMPVSKRKAYNGVAEVSVYISTTQLAKGLGSILMKKVIVSSEENGIWSLYSSIFPENNASYRLHLKNNFREIGIREKIAQLDGEWRNTLLLERRSQKVGL